MSGAAAGDDAARRFFDALQDSYRSAAAAAGEADPHYFQVAGHVVALRFAGAARSFTEAFVHLACEPVARPALTVHIFDSASTGTSPPPAPWRPDQVREAGIIESLSGERFRTVLQLATEMLSMLDRKRGSAVCWVRDAAALPMPERAAPLRRLLQGWLADRGLVLVHAAAVGTPQGGVLLTGPGGAGKSNSALACLDSSLLYAGDDYCAIGPGSELHVHSLYSTGKTAPSDLARLPFLEPLVANRNQTAEEKALYYLGRQWPDRMTTGFPLRAILVPRVSAAGETSLAPLSRGGALRALAPTSVLLSPQMGGSTLASIARIVSRLPAFELRLGRDHRRVPAQIAALLRKLEPRAEAASAGPGGARVPA